jgi:hypothetical protein
MVEVEGEGNGNPNELLKQISGGRSTRPAASGWWPERKGAGRGRAACAAREKGIRRRENVKKK